MHVESETGRPDPDEDQHDQAHSLLTIIRAVREAHSRAGQYQQCADPYGRRGVSRGSLEECGIAKQGFRHQQQRRQHEPMIGENTRALTVSATFAQHAEPMALA